MATANLGAKPHRQQSLFGESSETGGAALVTVAVTGRPLSEAERTFKRLTERIRNGRDKLAAWEAFTGRFQARLLGELKPVEDAIHAAQRRLVRRLHALLEATTGEHLSRRNRRRARVLIVDLAGYLLQSGPDAELEALHDRCSDLSRAERNRQEVEAAELLVGGVFGAGAVEGHEAQSVEELLRHAGERIAAGEALLREQAAGQGRRHGRPSKAQERKAQAAREASLSVREIYRKLASALHPDRETDAAERERKTALMQRVNQAYARDDLLELLALQIEIEQIDAAVLSNVPQVRLRHYNRVLQEQARALDAQIAERVGVFRVEFDLTMREVTPQQVERALEARVREARAFLAELERDLKRLDDPQGRRAFFETLPDQESEAPDLEELAALAALFGDMGPGSGGGSRKRRRR